MSGPGTGDDKIVILVMSVIPRVIPHTIVQTFYPGSDAGYRLQLEYLEGGYG